MNIDISSLHPTDMPGENYAINMQLARQSQNSNPDQIYSQIMASKRSL